MLILVLLKRVWEVEFQIVQSSWVVRIRNYHSVILAEEVVWIVTKLLDVDDEAFRANSDPLSKGGIVCRKPFQFLNSLAFRGVKRSRYQCCVGSNKRMREGSMFADYVRGGSLRWRMLTFRIFLCFLTLYLVAKRWQFVVVSHLSCVASFAKKKKSTKVTQQFTVVWFMDLHPGKVALSKTFVLTIHFHFCSKGFSHFGNNGWLQSRKTGKVPLWPLGHTFQPKTQNVWWNRLISWSVAGSLEIETIIQVANHNSSLLCFTRRTAKTA